MIKLLKYNWFKNLFLDIQSQNIPELANVSLDVFLKKLDSVNPSAVILTVVQPFAASRAPKVVENLPKPLTDLYQNFYQNLSLEELRSKEVDLSISI